MFVYSTLTAGIQCQYTDNPALLFHHKTSTVGKLILNTNKQLDMCMKVHSVLKMRLVSALVEHKHILCRPLANASIAPVHTSSKLVVVVVGHMH